MTADRRSSGDAAGPAARARPVLSPVACLRRLRAVLADQSLPLGQRLAVAAAVAWADGRTGLGSGSVRLIRRRTGLAPATILAGLDGATGRHLEPVTRGPAGVHRFRVLPVEGTSPQVPPGPGSASAGETLPTPVSAPPDETLTPDAALHSLPPSASAAARQRFSQCHTTAVRTSSSEQTSGGKAPPPAAARADGNGLGNDNGLPALAALAWERSPHPPGQTRQDSEETIRRHLAEKRYTLSALAAYLDAAETPGPFWELAKAIPRFLEDRDRAAREKLAALFATVHVGDGGTRKRDGARGVVDFRGCSRVRMKVTSPELSWIEITTPESFAEWAFSTAEPGAARCNGASACERQTAGDNP